jgi:transcriptional regulator with XRE-family HTH domain
MREDDVRRDVGAALRAIRESRKLLQREAAERMGITRSMLSMYERGHTQPTVATLERILAALDANLGTLAEHLAYARGFHPTAPAAAPAPETTRRQLVGAFNLWLKSVEAFRQGAESPEEPDAVTDEEVSP